MQGPRRAPAEECVRTRGSAHACVAIKKNDIALFVAARMDVEIHCHTVNKQARQRQISQVIPYTRNLKHATNKLIHRTEVES